MALTNRFNPRPPFRAGATAAHRVPFRHLPVSILARPFERALRRDNVLTIES